MASLSLSISSHGLLIILFKIIIALFYYFIGRSLGFISKLIGNTEVVKVKVQFPGEKSLTCVMLIKFWV